MPSFRLDRFLTLYFFHPLIRKKRPADDKKIPILMYHSISDDKESASHPYYHINTTPAVFTEQMRFLSENDYTVVDLKDLNNISSIFTPVAVEATPHVASPPPGGGGSPPSCFPPPWRGRVRVGGNCAVITFDDGYRDFYTNAIPILEKYHFPATVFLPTDFINDNRKTFKGKECLTWAEVRELHDKGISFGSHTVTHTELSSLSNKDVEYEISQSQKTIEDNLGKTIDTFSYPFKFPDGNKAFIKDLRNLLQKYEYHHGVSTRIGTTSKRDDIYFMKRIPINSGDDISLFKAKLEGGYNWLHKPQYLYKILKRKLQRKNA